MAIICKPIFFTGTNLPTVRNTNLSLGFLFLDLFENWKLEIGNCVFTYIGATVIFSSFTPNSFINCLFNLRLTHLMAFAFGITNLAIIFSQTGIFFKPVNLQFQPNFKFSCQNQPAKAK